MYTWVCFRLDLSLGDEALLAESEAVCRKQGGFMPREQWRAEMVKKLGR